jgi:hypothetical protein
MAERGRSDDRLEIELEILPRPDDVGLENLRQAQRWSRRGEAAVAGADGASLAL